MFVKAVCQVCGFVYDDAKETIPFSELPDAWKCPLCGAPKAEFQSEAAKPAASTEKRVPVMEKSDGRKLSVGQLAALCSNLARGCEKQYLTEEAGLFRELADYFTAITPAVEDPSLEKLARELKEDIEGYAVVRAAADAVGDRGAARICVWGEKVTRMLSSLVNRYLKEGEAMLADAEIWICTTCGFVYVGEAPPELCPVCKVPSWKFEKVEGGISA